MTSISASGWHQRYLQQATWTSQLRNYLIRKTSLSNASHILEVGCGTGAILQDLANTYFHTYGLDISYPNLRLAKENCPTSVLVQGDAHHLPYSDQQFDLVLCHFLLLWVKSAFHTVREMARVTRPGGVMIAMAEPDYGGRVDYPAKLSQLAEIQTQALQNQGADPWMGRKLASLFIQADILDIETGVIGGQWHPPDQEHSWQAEWQILEDDLKDVLSPHELAFYKEINRKAVISGERILYVPTFYTWGRKKL